MNKPTAQQGLTWLSAWLDSSYRGHGVTSEEAIDWRRFAKVGEEFGEATEAFYGVLGENPRKGVTHKKDDVIEELLDVAIAALGAVEHFSGKADSLLLLDHKIKQVVERAQLVEYGRKSLINSDDATDIVDMGRLRNLRPGAI